MSDDLSPTTGAPDDDLDLPEAVRDLLRGRFETGPSESLRDIGDSLHFDRRLVREDLTASIAHARMLGNQGIVPADDARLMVEGLSALRDEIEAGLLVVEGDDEDVHSWIERTLTERIGEAGARVHTARSRNDQVATAFRLWLRNRTDALLLELRLLQGVLLERAEETLDVIVPAYTHLQRGQPVRLAHHLMAYVEMLDRDLGRFRDQRHRMNQCPLGSGAATGVPYAIDRAAVATELGFDRATRNSMDTVADRDFATEWLAAASILAVHLSRLAEDVCLWASSEWRLLQLGDEVSTGSSIMPQKRNPDGAELVRGKSGRVFGSLMALLTQQKGLPLTYNRDLQEDKEPVFDAADTVLVCVRMTADTLRHSRFDSEAAVQLLRRGHLLATELADHLVGRGMPFRRAHETVGRLIRTLDERGLDLAECDEATLVAIEPELEGCDRALDFAAAVDRRAHPGGTARSRIERAIRGLKQRVAEDLAVG